MREDCKVVDADGNIATHALSDSAVLYLIETQPTVSTFSHGRVSGVEPEGGASWGALHPVGYMGDLAEVRAALPDFGPESNEPGRRSGAGHASLHATPRFVPGASGTKTGTTRLAQETPCRKPFASKGF